MLARKQPTLLIKYREAYFRYGEAFITRKEVALIITPFDRYHLLTSQQTVALSWKRIFFFLFVRRRWRGRGTYSYLVPGHEPGQVDDVRTSRHLVPAQHTVLKHTYCGLTSRYMVSARCTVLIIHKRFLFGPYQQPQGDRSVHSPDHTRGDSAPKPIPNIHEGTPALSQYRRPLKENYYSNLPLPELADICSSCILLALYLFLYHFPEDIRWKFISLSRAGAVFPIHIIKNCCGGSGDLTQTGKSVQSVQSV